MDRYDDLLELIREKGGLAVAFSGGVDSSLVALAAFEALGDASLALMAVNGTITRDEIEMARCTAREIGIRFLAVQIEVMDMESIVSNPVDRCGICKRKLMSDLMDRAVREGLGDLADGSLTEDREDHRPGLRASDEIGVWHPLMEAGIDKEATRKILREKGLSSYDRASTTCLATRIPYGERITRKKLAVIEEVERNVRGLGFRDVRLRLYSSKGGYLLGVLEVDDPERAFGLWDQIRMVEKELKLVIDPAGYRQGSMNEPLSNP
ncbi:MAG: ATP-dependent sacrificial sulfur transferase LarE [Candidatus Thermoplasmatota archaeon]|nr:ATP-dependent sacrificial sulfur transferase LarE [Candidatus Thermoplasmatota archaeon]